MFYKNTNISSIINIINPYTHLALVVSIKNSTFNYNQVASIIKDYTDEIAELWHHPIYMSIYDTTISSNAHSNGKSLISLNNGEIYIDNCIIVNNSYYEMIIEFHLSTLVLANYLDISNNHARYLIYSMKYSHTLLFDQCIFKATKNIVYWPLGKEIAPSNQVCYFQFLELPNSLCESTRIDIVDNIFTAPAHLIDSRILFTECEWIFDRTNDYNLVTPNDVFTKVLNITNAPTNKEDIGLILSSICRCANSTNYECSSHKLGQIIPGQSLTINLIVPKLLPSPKKNVMLKVETAHLPPIGCRVTKVTEILQSHTNTGCNQYNYTIWSNKTECELYLSAEGIPEIFYVELQPCPVGFSLHYYLQGCYCDSVLNSDVISVTTCNLADETILHPANSWISANTVNGTHRYHVSSQCPFDYCLPYSSYLNLFTHDSQCQFTRSGVLCGHCQYGLSAVFGSSQCKKCSNIYLLIIIPIAIAGIVLVMMLFILKLTVTDGTINTFIFYVTIVNTNYSTLLPNCHSPICVLLSIFNLDLRFETCFYNNMGDYSKTCLQLAFPLYLIMIALALIMGSRYSSRVQRLTSQRGLHVLATLFLLSYTKILSMVCHVLFFYTPVTHLPSRNTQLYWSVDTSIELFEIKFIVLFLICLIIFLILISFNVFLLLTRPSLRFNFISKFKPLLDPFLGPYKDKYFYWTGLQLLLRAMFFGLSALDNHTSVLSGAIVIAILLYLQGSLRPFKNQFNNILEYTALLNLLLIYVITLYNHPNYVNSMVTQYLTLVVLVYFIFFVIYTCIVRLLNRKIQQIKDGINSHLKGWKISKKSKNESFELSEHNVNNQILDMTLHYNEFQEPLVAVTD